MYVLATRVRDRVERLPVPPTVAGAAPPLLTRRSPRGDKHTPGSSESWFTCCYCCCVVVVVVICYIVLRTVFTKKHTYTIIGVSFGEFPAQAAAALPGQTARELDSKSLHWIVLEALSDNSGKTGANNSKNDDENTRGLTWLRFGHVDVHPKKQKVCFFFCLLIVIY
jgi:hypothetical protein